MLGKINCVLIIDDDPISTYVTQTTFKAAGVAHRIETKNNAADALHFIAHFQEEGNCCPELIVVDINMVGIDGFEFVDFLMTRDFDNKDKIVIVALTAQPLHKSREKNHSFKEVLIKPFKKEEVSFLVEKYFIKGGRTCDELHSKD